jgi:hypothetical protein
MTDDEMREALRLALNAWEAAKRQAEAADEEREYLDAVMNGEVDWA